MSFFGNIGSWLGKNALELLGLGAGVGTNLWNQHNQNKQNEFNASQAQLNRNFQAEQAQLARNYQTEFYETYQSPSAMVRQYQDAGMNPALMAGGYNPPSAVSTSVPSGSAASASSPNYQSMESMVNMIGQMAQLKAVIDNTKADSAQKRAQASLAAAQVGVAGAEQAYKTSLKNVTDAQVNVVNEQFSLLAAQTKNEQYKMNLLTLEREIKELQRNQDLDEAKFQKEYGFYPNDSLQTAILKIAQKKGNDFADWLASHMRLNLPNFTASVPLFNEWVKKRGF